MMLRREIVQILFLTTFLQVFAEEVQIQGNPSVVIVGAGPAGLAAAVKLLESGVTNIKVLEAEDRIGGRIHSVKFGDAYVDVGAEFCHGQKGNVVYELVKDLNVLTHSPSIEEIELRYSNGSEIGGELQADWSKFFLARLGPNSGPEFSQDDIPDEAPVLSLGEAWTKSFNDTLQKKYKDDEESLKILQEALRALEFYVASYEGSFRWSEVAAVGGYKETEGDQGMTWSGFGSKTVLEVLLKSLPDPKQRLAIDDSIFLNKKVTKITWDSPESGVVVECSDQTTYTTDHVIVTPSIGVLKHDHSKMFSPQLPETKQDAIKDIGFGGVMKIILHFPDNWWGKLLPYTYFVWSDEDLNDIRDSKVSWIDSISSVENSANNTHVAILWVTGPKVPEIEKVSDKNLLEGSMFFLQNFLGAKYNITAPDKMLRSSWYSNPNFRGTYSFETVESARKKQSNQEELAKPLVKNGVPVVLFAGEASNPVHYSTVHGAIETGRREADRIIGIYSKNLAPGVARLG